MKKLVPRDSILVPEAAERVFEGEIFDVYQWQQELFDGGRATFEMLRRPDTTAVIAIVDDKIIVLDDEQPHRASKKSFPGGRVDLTDVDITVAAQREMLEEAGYEFDNWRLVDVQQHAGKIEWFIHVLIAWDGRKVAEPQQDGGERITVHLETLEEVKRLAADDVDYINESAHLLERVHTIEDLLALPPFEGLEIER